MAANNTTIITKSRDASLHMALAGLRAAIANEMEIVATQVQMIDSGTRRSKKLSPTRSMVAAGHIILGLLRDAERRARMVDLRHAAPRLQRACWQIPMWRSAVEAAYVPAARYDGDRNTHPAVVHLARTCGRVLAELHALLGPTQVGDA